MNNQSVFHRRAASKDSDKFPMMSEPEESSTDEIKGNIFQRQAQLNQERKDNKFGFFDTVKDVEKQVLAKGVAGAGGAYGNIADLIGIQPKSGEQLPGEKARYSQQFAVLEKLDRGEIPSLGEFLLLSDDDIAPSYSRISNTNDIKQLTKELTGVGEGETPAGRIAGRGAEFIGEGLALGGNAKGLLSLGGSGLAGQSLREVGAPESLATGVEIVGSFAPSIVEGRLRPTRGSAAEQTVEQGRKLGLNEKQITPLVQGETKTSVLSKVAHKGEKNKELFASIKERLGDSYNRIKASPEAKKALTKVEQGELHREFTKIRHDLSRTLAPSPEKEAAIAYIDKSLMTLRKGRVTPEHLVNFWQDVNKTVKWNSIQGGKQALARLKNPVADTLKKVSPKLAEDFEMTNNLYSKYSQISRKLKPDIVDSFINKGEIAAIPAAGIAFVTGNPWVAAGIGSEITARILAREMLINPYFQNLATKLVQNFNAGSMKAVEISVKQAQEYLQRKHPNEDWSFLTEVKD